MLKVLQVRT